MVPAHRFRSTSVPCTATPARCLVHEPLLLRLSDQCAIHVIIPGTHSWHQRRRAICAPMTLTLAAFTSRRRWLDISQCYCRGFAANMSLFGSLRASHPGFARDSLLVLNSCDLIRFTFRFFRGDFSGDLDGVETIVNTYEGAPQKMHVALLSPAKSATVMDAQSRSSAYWSTTTYCLWT